MARSVERKNTARALTPRITNGVVHHVEPLTSTSQKQAPSPTTAAPAVNTAYELVHSALLMGKSRPHARPITTPAPPLHARPLTAAAVEGAACTNRPVRTPKSVVAMAGSVLRMPSGS